LGLGFGGEVSGRVLVSRCRFQNRRNVKQIVKTRDGA